MRDEFCSLWVIGERTHAQWTKPPEMWCLQEALSAGLFNGPSLELLESIGIPVKTARCVDLMPPNRFGGAWSVNSARAWADEYLRELTAHGRVCIVCCGSRVTRAFRSALAGYYSPDVKYPNAWGQRVDVGTAFTFTRLPTHTKRWPASTIRHLHEALSWLR